MTTAAGEPPPVGPARYSKPNSRFRSSNMAAGTLWATSADEEKVGGPWLLDNGLPQVHRCFSRIFASSSWTRTIASVSSLQ